MSSLHGLRSTRAGYELTLAVRQALYVGTTAQMGQRPCTIGRLLDQEERAQGHTAVADGQPTLETHT
jgi:hypothetical protein